MNDDIVRDAVALNRDSQAIWDAKAEFWDAGMGEGNAFHRELIGPATERLLAVSDGELILDIACGNGQVARRLAQLGARVVATDFSARFLELARARTVEHVERIDYRQVDATDEAQLLALGEGSFDAAVCGMALMDMPEIEPLALVLPRLLKPGGRFIFTVQHPCFNSNAVRLTVEEGGPVDRLVESYAVKVTGYLRVPPGKGGGMPGEPAPHWYFHRPLGELLSVWFRHGFVMDGIEEPAFSPGYPTSRTLSWLSYNDIPPVLAVRLRLR
jgi:SAM-dependent methyltransferase